MQAHPGLCANEGSETSYCARVAVEYLVCTSQVLPGQKPLYRASKMAQYGVCLLHPHGGSEELAPESPPLNLHTLATTHARTRAHTR